MFSEILKPQKLFFLKDLKKIDAFLTGRYKEMNEQLLVRLTK